MNAMNIQYFQSEYWDTGIPENSAEILGYWIIGILENSNIRLSGNIGILEYWNPGKFHIFYIGILEYWKLESSKIPIFNFF